MAPQRQASRMRSPFRRVDVLANAARTDLANLQMLLKAAGLELAIPRPPAKAKDRPFGFGIRPLIAARALHGRLGAERPGMAAVGQHFHVFAAPED